MLGLVAQWREGLSGLRRQLAGDRVQASAALLTADWPRPRTGGSYARTYAVLVHPAQPGTGLAVLHRSAGAGAGPATHREAETGCSALAPVGPPPL